MSLVYMWSGVRHWCTRGAGSRVTGTCIRVEQGVSLVYPWSGGHITVSRSAAFATADKPRSASALATITRALPLRPNSRSVTSARSQPHASSSGVSSVSSFNQSVYEIGSLSIPVSRAEHTAPLTTAEQLATAAVPGEGGVTGGIATVHLGHSIAAMRSPLV